MQINVDLTKIVLWAGGVIVTLAMTIGTIYIDSINTQLTNISDTIKELKDNDLKDIIENIHEIELTLNRTTYNEQSLLNKIEILKEEVKELEEKLL